ncbi:O-antigen ligase family protein [Arthrobacter sp. TMS1-12-1]
MASVALIVLGAKAAFSMLLPPSVLWLLLFSLLYVAVTALNGDLSKTAVAASQAVMWVAVNLYFSNLNNAELKLLLRAGLTIAALQVLIAVFESVFQTGWVQQSIAAAVDRGYPFRSNRILGLPFIRAQGTFGYPIAFGHFAALGALASFIFSVRCRSRSAGLLTLFLFGGVLLSGTRSALVALIFSVIVYASLSFARNSLLKRASMVLGVTTSAAFVVLTLGQDFLADDISVLHRAGVISALPRFRLLDFTQVLFGSGYDSHETLFQSGIIPNHGTYAVDNAFITFLITSGLVGLVLILFLLVGAWRRGDNAAKATLVLFVAMFMSYDVQNWHAVSFLLFACTGIAYRSRVSALISSPTKRVHEQAGAGFYGRN